VTSSHDNLRQDTNLPLDLRVHLWYNKWYVENTEFLTHLAEKTMKHELTVITRNCNRYTWCSSKVHEPYQHLPSFKNLHLNESSCLKMSRHVGWAWPEIWWHAHAILCTKLKNYLSIQMVQFCFQNSVDQIVAICKCVIT
jgi:hypothetical protein